MTTEQVKALVAALRDILDVLADADTDKKHSQINMLLTRGKRVVAEAMIKKDLVKDLMGVDTKTLSGAARFPRREVSWRRLPTTARTQPTG